MKLLLTAFDPFGGEAVNAAQEVVKKLKLPEGIEVLYLTVPTVFAAAAQTVLRTVDTEKPDAVVCVGQAAGRSAITPERIAINCRDARIPDNHGFFPHDEAIVPLGPAAFFSTLPIRAMTEAILARGIPAQISNSAGTFVCNDLMYGVLYGLAERKLSIPAGFIHVPCLPEQAARLGVSAFMDIDQAAEGLSAALSCLQ